MYYILKQFTHKNKLIDVGIVVIDVADTIKLCAGCFAKNCRIGYIETVEYSKEFLNIDNYDNKSFEDGSYHFKQINKKNFGNNTIM